MKDSFDCKCANHLEKRNRFGANRYVERTNQISTIFRIFRWNNPTIFLYCKIPIVVFLSCMLVFSETGEMNKKGGDDIRANSLPIPNSSSKESNSSSKESNSSSKESNSSSKESNSGDKILNTDSDIFLLSDFSSLIPYFVPVNYSTKPFAKNDTKSSLKNTSSEPRKIYLHFLPKWHWSKEPAVGQQRISKTEVTSVEASTNGISNGFLLNPWNFFLNSSFYIFDIPLVVVIENNHLPSEIVSTFNQITLGKSHTVEANWRLSFIYKW